MSDEPVLYTLWHQCQRGPLWIPFQKTMGLGVVCGAGVAFLYQALVWFSALGAWD